MKLGDVDVAAHRIKLWVTALLVVVAIASGVGSLVANAVTRDVRAGVLANRDYIAAVQNQMLRRSAADSVARDRMVRVIELAVVVLVEDDGSPERAAARRELRKLRTVTR